MSEAKSGGRCSSGSKEGSSSSSSNAKDDKHSAKAEDEDSHVAPSREQHPSLSSESKDGSSLSPMEEKIRMVELEEDLEVEEEFAALMRQRPTEGEVRLAADPRARKVALGFSIASMNMRDAASGSLIWRSSRFGDDMFEREMEERIPKSILKCRAVAREIVFSSRETLNNFRLEQRVFFQGHCIEEWFFTFGFVIPGSTNSWQQIIEAAPPDQMLPAEELSGNITFETSFFDEGVFLCKNLFRIFYV